MPAPSRPARRRRTPFLPALALALTFMVPIAAQTIHAGVEASVDASALASTGRAVLKLKFECEAPPLAPHSVRVELRTGRRVLLRRQHAPPIPTTKWKPGEPVTYDLPLFFALAPRASGEVEVWIGFYDPREDETTAPLTTGRTRNGMARVASFRFPQLTEELDAAAIEATITAARELAKKDPRAAWDQLEFAFRRTADYRLKAQLREVLLDVGRVPPAPLSFEEEGIVAGRIRAERTRYLREIAGRLFDRGKLFGALILLDEVGGKLQQDADRAVLGALNEARRVTKDRDAIADTVFAIDAAQQAEVRRLTEEHPQEAERLEFGLAMAKAKKRRPVARELIRTVEFTPELREEAAAARREIERVWLSEVPPDERAAADAAMNHACWGRTSRRASHRFVLIGPKHLLAGVPEESLLRFDVAYLYLTDLFGRVPNPQGDRVTVYFKELWDFGGGIGGGKIIDVGRADPKRSDQRVDTGLFYHEFTHCVDDTRPIYAGFREGLADFGAAFTYHELGQIAAARASIGLASRAFLGDYLERDLEYWRIPNYGPSAGFLLHFVQQYGREGKGYAWQLYRKFFRNYRACDVDDARAPTLARAFAFHLTEAFGEAAFADLIRFRWPLLPQDLAAVRLEQKAARRSMAALALEDAPGSPVPRDLTASELRADRVGPVEHREELGIVQNWWVIGPFRKRGVDPDTYRFPPELEIDLKARYDSIGNSPTWRRPGPKPVTVDPSGWLRFHFSYMDDSALYALSHVTVDEQTEAWFHIRGDDDVTLFVGDALIGKYTGTRGPHGPWRPGWQVMLPDAVRFPVTLQPGRTKVLLKVRNRRDGSGCTLAIARRNGTPLPGWSTDAEPPAKKLATIEVPDAKKWRSRFKLNATRSGAQRKLDARVGQWRVRNRALEGTSTNRGVEWRKYTVRPGFPKDSPSNLTWLPEKATKDLGAFRLTIDLDESVSSPKLCVILQGDGRRDALGGWTLILTPRGDGVRGRLERYDRLVYQSDVVPVVREKKNPLQLELVHFGDRLTVRLGGEVLFDQASIRAIPGRHRVGIATWGPRLRLTGLELRAPGRTRSR